MDAIVNIGLYLSYFLLIVGVLVTLGSSIIYIVLHPNKAKETLIGLGFLVGVLLIGYLISGSEVGPIHTKFGIGSGLSKFIGGTIISMYIFGGIAIVYLLYSEVTRFFK